MPKYSNSTGQDITVDGLRIPARAQNYVSEFFIKSDLPAGITKESDLPLFNMLLIDQIYTVDSIILIPTSLTINQSMTVEVVATSGDVRLFLQSTDNTPGYLTTVGNSGKFQINPWSVEQILVRFITVTGSESVHIRIWAR